MAAPEALAAFILRHAALAHDLNDLLNLRRQMIERTGTPGAESDRAIRYVADIIREGLLNGLGVVLPTNADKRA